MRITRTLSLLLILFSSMAFAEITAGPAAKPQGDLGLVIVASDTPDYIHEWLTTPSQHGVTIKRLKMAKPDQLIVSSFLVTGLSRNEEGRYDFSVSFYVLGPNNKPIFGQRDYAKGSGILPDKPILVMADPALDIVLENTDPEGKYSIVAKVTDLVNGRMADDSYNIVFAK